MMETADRKPGHGFLRPVWLTLAVAFLALVGGLRAILRRRAQAPASAVPSLAGIAVTDSGGGHISPEQALLRVVGLRYDTELFQGGGSWPDPLYALDDLSFRIGNKAVAEMSGLGPDEWHRGGAFDPRAGKIGALLLTSLNGTPHFLPLSRPLKDDDPLKLSFTAGGERVRVDAGVVRAPCGVVGILRFAENLSGPDWSIQRVDNGRSLLIYAKTTPENIQLSSSNGRIPCGVKDFPTDGKAGKKLDCKDFNGLVSALRPDVGASPQSLASLRPSGVLDITAKDTAGRELRCPLLRYSLPGSVFAGPARKSPVTER